jgi:AcrR family transcriptional regulator
VTGVHPVADLFPMLPDDELKELAADITERGLLQLIVLDSEGRILDGRNRLAACEIAGVEPEFVIYDGDDPDGYAYSVNVKRRNLTKAQIAVIAADRFAVKNLTVREIAEEAGISPPMVTWANAVRRYPDLHERVLAGGKDGSLKDAYDEAVERDEAEEIRQQNMARLRDDAPDLHALVEEEQLTVDDAIAAHDARRSKEAQEALERASQRESELRAARSNLSSVLTYLTSSSIPADRLAEQEYGDVIGEFDLAELTYAAQTMAAIAQRRSDHGEAEAAS